jgi:hypothetical protein
MITPLNTAPSQTISNLDRISPIAVVEFLREALFLLGRILEALLQKYRSCFGGSDKTIDSRHSSKQSIAPTCNEFHTFSKEFLIPIHNRVYLLDRNLSNDFSSDQVLDLNAKLINLSELNIFERNLVDISIADIFCVCNAAHATELKSPSTKIIFCTGGSYLENTNDQQIKLAFLAGCYLIMYNGCGYEETLVSFKRFQPSFDDQTESSVSVQDCWRAMCQAKCMNWIDFQLTSEPDHGAVMCMEEYTHYARCAPQATPANITLSRTNILFYVTSSSDR